MAQNSKVTKSYTVKHEPAALSISTLLSPLGANIITHLWCVCVCCPCACTSIYVCKNKKKIIYSLDTVMHISIFVLPYWNI